MQTPAPTVQGPHPLLRLAKCSTSIDGSGPLRPERAEALTSTTLNALIDAALAARNRGQPPRDYLGGSRIGEPCNRKLVYELTTRPMIRGRFRRPASCASSTPDITFEDLSIRWLREAGFDLRDRGRTASSSASSTAGGRLRGHVDGVIVGGPDIGIRWPALLEHKALNARSWARPREARRSGSPSRSISRRSSSTWPTSSSRRHSSPRSTRTTRRSTTRSSPSSRRWRRRFPTGPSPSSALPTPASCRRASPAAADFYLCRWCPSGAALLGGRRMSFQPSPQQAARHGRRPRLVPPPSGTAPGLPALWLRRHRQVHDHRAMPSATLGLDLMDRDGGRGNVLYAAFTGKAALVMTRNGTPASTIHSLIYKVWEATPEEIAAANRSSPSCAQTWPAWAGGAQVRDGAGPAARAAPRRYAPAPLRAEREVAGARRRPPRPRRGVDGRRRHGGGPSGLRQADPGAGRSRPAAADPRRGRLHRHRAGRAAHRDPPQAGESAVLRLATMARKGEPIRSGSTTPSSGRCGGRT